jgi:hypothetical protein
MGSLWREVSLAIITFASAYALWYVKDRKKSRAETAVAEGTVGSDIDLNKITRDTASVVLLDRAFQMERASKDREIAALSLKVEHLEVENADLRNQVARLTARLNKLDPPEEVPVP